MYIWGHVYTILCRSKLFLLDCAAVFAGSGGVFVLRGFRMAVGVISRFKDVFSVHLCTTAYSYMCYSRVLV